MSKINPKHELFKWGPIDGRLIYPDFFNVAFVLYSRKYHSWPDLIGYLKNEKITFIADYPELRNSGEINFKKYILNDKRFKINCRQWRKNLTALEYFKKIINAKHLAKLSGKELNGLFENWSEKYFNFWVVGQIPELANWGGEQMLKRELLSEISAQDFNYVFERLSAPEKLSFYQRADLELLKLRAIRDKKLLNKRLVNYQRGHFWLLNSYHHSQTLSKNYFKKELLSYKPAEAKKKINELSRLSSNIKREKKKIIKKFKLARQIGKIAKRLAFCIWWQDLRKFYIFLANYQLDLFLREFSRRHEVSFYDLHDYNYYELLEQIKNNKKVPTDELKQRRAGMIVYYSEKNNSLKYFSGERAIKFIKPYLEIKIAKNIKEIKGIVVSGGKKLKAKVKILTSPKEVDKIKPGEILVVAMTSPDYITAIKKAGAIITDEGGMTCHAAIVSRELRIPCIVATKIATKILKDGDLVEVDADKGIVKIIKH
ncbi:hypothetical protein A2V95_03700 [Candidatus Kuenenbacteria bacterium RBG_16_41_7]|uniref:PEP-utilising enzyme mobile domain-containing protein n=1 Tax=Candidatus Kuenenbacteria bacterium RBG_16_41_7 TaxID=1798560 RepID=A0A1F6GC86_9BACT|nr:MAG: hypothetical protein A2V95_03700 [Candidatus Kuenenbacteria bacterium RBG_16_41_7]